MFEKYTFKDFLRRNWWFLFLGFARAVNYSYKDSATGSKFFDILLYCSIILIIMFAYWFIRYGYKQSKK